MSMGQEGMVDMIVIKKDGEYFNAYGIFNDNTLINTNCIKEEDRVKYAIPEVATVEQILGTYGPYVFIKSEVEFSTDVYSDNN